MTADPAVASGGKGWSKLRVADGESERGTLCPVAAMFDDGLRSGDSSGLGTSRRQAT